MANLDDGKIPIVKSKWSSILIKLCVLCGLIIIIGVTIGALAIVIQNHIDDKTEDKRLSDSFDAIDKLVNVLLSRFTKVTDDCMYICKYVENRLDANIATQNEKWRIFMEGKILLEPRPRIYGQKGRFDKIKFDLESILDDLNEGLSNLNFERPNNYIITGNKNGETKKLLINGTRELQRLFEQSERLIQIRRLFEEAIGVLEDFLNYSTNIFD
jgi:hypothetical protein